MEPQRAKSSNAVPVSTVYISALSSELSLSDAF